MKSRWDVAPLGDVLQKTETIDPTRWPTKEFQYVDVSSISNTRLEIIATQTIRGKSAPSRARRLIKRNDVLFATIRPTLRRIAIVPDALDGQICSTGYFVLRASDKVDPGYLFYYLQTDTFMEQMQRLQKGASYPAVTDGDVRSQRIAIPPLDIQRKIVAQLNHLNRYSSELHDLYQRKLATLEELKKSLLHQAFSGAL